MKYFQLVRSLRHSATNNTTTESELTIVWACERFRAYLYGVEFELVTDHKPLTYLSALNLSSSRLIRWKMRLQEYNFKIMHKAGKDHVNADVLSRMYEDQGVNNIEESTVVDDKYMKRMQCTDEGIRETYELVKSNGGRFNNFLISNGVLFCVRKELKEYEPQEIKRLVVPRALIGEVLTLCHDHVCGGHMGKNKTWAKVASRYYWSEMKKDVMEWVDSCPECSERKDPPASRMTLGSITDPGKPFDKIGIDFLGPLTETSEGNRHILVITDYATRWVEAFPTKDQKAATVAKILVDEVICRHGAPRELLSDKGRQFLSAILKEICGYFDIKKLNTQCNGLTERFNNTLCQMLSMYVDAKQDNWDYYLPLVLFAYRTSQQKTVRETPFRLLYGRDARLPSDLDNWSTKAYFIKDMDKVWAEANKLIVKQAQKATETLSKKFPTTKPLAAGDFVRLQNPVTPIGLKKKLRRDQWRGPHKVIRVEYPNIVLQQGDKQETVHGNRVKLAEKKRSIYGREYKPVDRLGIMSINY